MADAQRKPFVIELSALEQDALLRLLDLGHDFMRPQPVPSNLDRPVVERKNRDIQATREVYEALRERLIRAAGYDARVRT